MTAPPDVRRDDEAPTPGALDRCPHCGAGVDDAWLNCASCGEALAAAAELPPGTLLHGGRFEVLALLGRGGFGITYEVADHRLQRRVAVKELFPESAVRHGSTVLTPPHARPAFRDARSRFLREARVLARFTHSGIVRVYEVFEEHNTAYLVMELLEGRTLLDILRERGRPFSESEVLDVAARVAAALRSVHAAGVLHRDINPSNIVLTDHGRIVVIDFGLARSYVAEQSAPITCVVTPGYAPIEQYVGEGGFGPSSDVYGLAATLYRLATGRIPVPALERQAGAELPSPHRLNPAISKVVSDGLLDGLEINAGHRPQTLDAFLRRLGLAHEPRPPRSLLLDSLATTATTPTTPPPVVAEPGASPEAEVSRAPPSPPVGPRPPAPADRTVLEPDLHRPAGAPARATGDLTELDSNLHRPVGAAARAPGDLTELDSNLHRPVGPAATAQVPPVDTVVAAPTDAAGPGVPAGGRAWTPTGGSAPVALGPHPPGRWKVTVPVAVAALAIGSAAPLTAIVVLALVVLPLLATWGDSVVHRMRRDSGSAQGWLERSTPPAAAAPLRLVGNVVISAVRAVPVLAITAALFAMWVGLDHLNVAQPVLDVVLRGIGLLTIGLLVLPARRGSPRFRTGVALDHAASRLLEEGGRVGQRAVVLWLVAAFVAVGGLWLTPEVWPLPH